MFFLALLILLPSASLVGHTPSHSALRLQCIFSKMCSLCSYHRICTMCPGSRPKMRKFMRSAEPTASKDDHGNASQLLAHLRLIPVAATPSPWIPIGMHIRRWSGRCFNGCDSYLGVPSICVQKDDTISAQPLKNRCAKISLWWWLIKENKACGQTSLDDHCSVLTGYPALSHTGKLT